VAVVHAHGVRVRIVFRHCDLLENSAVFSIELVKIVEWITQILVGWQACSRRSNCEGI